MASQTWKEEEVARRHLDEVRGAIPYGPDQLRIMLQLVARFRPLPRRIVDLGCGDGIMARTLLEAFPDARAFLADHSEPMLRQAREAMAPYARRCEVVRADLSDPINGWIGAEEADLIVSGYAIHHLPHARKRALYSEIYEALTPGGMFLNLEHVASPTPELEDLFHSLFQEHLNRHACRNGLGPSDTGEDGKKEYKDSTDNILEGVEVQLHWLREIGFRQVDCYFKWLELAVFGGMKPSG
ncbi:MAG: methyltransferase domain-containing protein [Armatimonadetes bacterium]|nr:methyltransferase domain-containing protein [Armatimonadota bacterium]